MVAKVYIQHIKPVEELCLPERFQVRVKVEFDGDANGGQGFDMIVGSYKTKEKAFDRKNKVILGFSDCFCTDDIEEIQ
ncbi:hypothetical protein [Paenibacillus sp. MMO-177]|uniref:hypothetical protein n=1 Tax=Paenibacillus sp. MMO-177 TaxID=3081289 RepID=UPI0030161E14